MWWFVGLVDNLESGLGRYIWTRAYHNIHQRTYYTSIWKSRLLSISPDVNPKNPYDSSQILHVEPLIEFILYLCNIFDIDACYEDFIPIEEQNNKLIFDSKSEVNKVVELAPSETYMYHELIESHIPLSRRLFQSIQ